MGRLRFKPDPVFSCLFYNDKLIAIFASPLLGERFAAHTGVRYTTRTMTLRELAGIEEAGRINGKMRDAVRMGARGGSLGGRIRAARLSPERRRSIAMKAAQIRWAK